MKRFQLSITYIFLKKTSALESFQTVKEVVVSTDVVPRVRRKRTGLRGGLSCHPMNGLFLERYGMQGPEYVKPRNPKKRLVRPPIYVGIRYRET